MSSFPCPSHPEINWPSVMADMTDLQACQVPSAQSWCHVTPSAACQKLIVLIGERQSCNKALRGNPPTQMKALRFVLCQGLVGNRRIRWPAGQEGRTTVLWPVCVWRGKRKGDVNQGIHPLNLPRHKKLESKNVIITAHGWTHNFSSELQMTFRSVQYFVDVFSTSAVSYQCRFFLTTLTQKYIHTDVYKTWPGHVCTSEASPMLWSVEKTGVFIIQSQDW